MKSSVAWIFVALAATGCSSGNVHPTMLRMEVAYSALGNLGGGQRVWAVYRVPSGLVVGIEPDDEVIAHIRCRMDECSVFRVTKRAVKADSQDGSSSLMLAGRLLETDADGKDSLLILQPFPRDFPRRLFDQLEFQPGMTKVIEVRYRQWDATLDFQDLRLVKVEKKDPVRWK